MTFAAYHAPLALCTGLLVSSTAAAQEHIPFDWPRESGAWTYQQHPEAVIEPGQTHEGIAVEPDGVAHYEGWELFYDRPPGVEEAQLAIYRSPDRRFFAVGDQRAGNEMVQVAVVDTQADPGPGAITLNGGVVMGPMVSPMRPQTDVRIQSGVAFSPDGDVVLARAYMSVDDQHANEALVWSHMPTGQIGESLGNFYEGANFQTDIARTRSSTAGSGEVTITFKHRDCGYPCDETVAEHQLPAEMLREMTFRMPLPEPREIETTVDVVDSSPSDEAEKDSSQVTEETGTSWEARDVGSPDFDQAATTSGAEQTNEQALFGPHAVISFDGAYDCLGSVGWPEFRACLDDAGASDAGIAAARELSGGDSQTFFSNYWQTSGPVDIGEIQVPAAGSTSRQGFVRHGREFDLAGFERMEVQDTASRRLQRQYPDAVSYSPAWVIAHRYLDDGGQRFTLAAHITDGCRACDLIAISIGYVDFSNGELIDRGTIGWAPQRGDLGAASEDVRRRLHDSDVLEVQIQLNRLGYIAGPMDGAYGPMTEAALGEFRREHCLGDDADWTRATADKLSELYDARGPVLAEAECGPGGRKHSEQSEPNDLGSTAYDADETMPFRDGVYATEPMYCAPSPEERAALGDGLGVLRQVIDGRHIDRGYEVSCEIDSVAAHGDLLKVEAGCMAEGYREAREWTVKQLSDTAFIERGGFLDGKRFDLCELHEPEFTTPRPDASRDRAEAILEAYDGDISIIEEISRNAQYATLANAVYSGNMSPGNGWVGTRNYRLPSLRVLGENEVTLFSNPEVGLVLAFPGTNQWTDIPVWISLSRNQVREAATLGDNVASAYPEREINFVGHSLGGRLAQVAAGRAGGNAIVFNSAPLDSFESAAYGRETGVFDPPTVISFRAKNDIVSRIFPRAREDIEIVNYPNFTPAAGSTVLDRIKFNHDSGLLEVIMNEISANIENIRDLHSSRGHLHDP